MNSASGFSKMLVILIVVVVVLGGIGIAYFAMTNFAGPMPSPNPTPKLSPTATPVPSYNPIDPKFNISSSNKSIVRNTDTKQEETALQSAESFDYTNAVNATLYRGQYANFIDTNVISYYSQQADSSKPGTI